MAFDGLGKRLQDIGILASPAGSISSAAIPLFRATCIDLRDKETRVINKCQKSSVQL